MTAMANSAPARDRRAHPQPFTDLSARAALRQMRAPPLHRNVAPTAEEPAIERADGLVGKVDAPMGTAFFTGSGPEANDTRVKPVRHHNDLRGRPDKKKISARRGAHRDTAPAAAGPSGARIAAPFDARARAPEDAVATVAIAA